MVRTWYLGDADQLAGLPVSDGDVVVPLDAFTQAALGARSTTLPELAQWEAEAPEAVFADVARAIRSLEGGGQEWLRYRGHVLSGALSKPDVALTVFPKQALAWRIARHAPRGGHAVAAGASPFQREGLRAALGSAPDAWPEPPGPPARRWWQGLRPRSLTGPPARADILYMALEPHVVAQQQDRVLAALAADHTIAVVVPLRTPWSWPAGTSFTPADVRPLARYLGRRQGVRLAGTLARHSRLPDTRVLEPPPWFTHEAWRRWVRREWWRAALSIEALEAAIAAHRPRLFVATNLFSSAGKLAVSVCRAAGVPALGMPSGADFMAPPQLAAADVMDATYVLSGPAMRDLLVASGVPAERLVALGLPELDAYVPLRATETRGAFLTRHGLDPARPVAVFFSSPSVAQERSVVPAAAKRLALDALLACRERVLVQVLVKLHPRETDGVIVEHLARVAPGVPIASGPLTDVLQAADVVASLGSAVTFTAALLGKPALILDFGRSPLLTDVFRRTGAGRAPATPEDVPAVVREMLDGSRGPSTEFVRDWLAGADGRTSERIAALARRLMSSAATRP